MEDDGHDSGSAAAASVSQLMLSLVRKRIRRTLKQWAAVLIAFVDKMAEVEGKASCTDAYTFNLITPSQLGQS